jgi:hypothetical protein
MRRKHVRNGIYPVVPVVAVLLAMASPLSAQMTSFHQGGWWIGYVGKAPQQLLGIGTTVMGPQLGGFGLFADVKTAHDSPARGAFRSDLTPDQALDFGDIQVRQQSAWTSVNAGVVKALGPQIALYAGGGLGDRRIFTQFSDNTMERHETGIYWVEEESQSGRFANVMGGAFFRMAPRFVFQLGAETAPGGFTAGMHIVLR